MRVNIQWYPGHMARAMRELEKSLAVVDVVLEIRDARIPRSSHNADLAKLVSGKPVITILAKEDLAERAQTEAWIKALEDQGLAAVAVDFLSGRGLRGLEAMIRSVHQSHIEHLRKRGRQDQVLRGVVLGVPNVGKSTLINRLARRSAARTGAKPGVTRGRQWVRVSRFLQLLDVPGVLWPKFDDPKVGFNLAVTGAISDDVFDYVQVGAVLADYMTKTKPQALVDRYGIDLDLEEGEELLDAIGRRRGFLLAGGRVDLEKAALLLLREFRQGLLGAVTLEDPPDIPNV